MSEETKNEEKGRGKLDCKCTRRRRQARERFASVPWRPPVRIRSEAASKERGKRRRCSRMREGEGERVKNSFRSVCFTESNSPCKRSLLCEFSCQWLFSRPMSKVLPFTVGRDWSILGFIFLIETKMTVLSRMTGVFTPHQIKVHTIDTYSYLVVKLYTVRTF